MADPNSNPVVVSCVNLKGGVGKTALAVNFAAYCGTQGKRTLLIDLDPQTNATFSCIDVDQWEEHAKDYGTVADLLGAKNHTAADGSELSPTEVLRNGVFKNVDLIPSHLDLFTVDLDLAGTTARETRLRRSVQPILNDYEIVVCDCPPNLAICTQNALAMSNFFVVPISPEYLAGIGVGILLKRINQLSADLERDLTHAGIVISRVGRPALHREQTVATIRETFPDLVFETEIKERVAVSKAAEQKQSVFDMEDTEASYEFSSVSTELLERIGVAE